MTTALQEITKWLLKNKRMKNIILAIILLWFAGIAQAQNTVTIDTTAFVTTWKTSNDTIFFPGYGTHFTVKWTDYSGLPGHSGSKSLTALRYGFAYLDTIVVPDTSKIWYLSVTDTAGDNFGGISYYYWNNTPDLPPFQHLLTVENWGSSVVWYSVLFAFEDCDALTSINAKDAPNLTQATDMQDMFAGCTHLATAPYMNTWDVSHITSMDGTFIEDSLFNANINDWDVSNVTNMVGMFDLCTSFNQPLDKWDVSNAPDMFAMFEAATSFNQDISGWDMSLQTDLSNMFAYAISFNQPIGKWKTGNVKSLNLTFWGATSFNQDLSNWDVSHVTTLDQTFSGATSFNQDLSSWDVSHATNLYYTFNGAKSFNQSLANWNLSGIAPSTIFSLVGMLDSCGMSCENYAKTLVGWANNSVGSKGNGTTPSNIILDAYGRSYSAGAQTAHDILTNAAGWTIRNDAKGTCDITPVTLLRFTAQIQTNNTALLQWTTATETNNKGFSIQRSTDGATWSGIAFVNSQAAGGNSTATLNYTYTDNTPASGINYYRLQQQNTDGTVAYSKVESVSFEGSNAITVYPNPASTQLNVTTGSAGSYQLINTAGNIMLKGNLQAGYNSINTGALPDGMYILHIVGNDNSTAGNYKVVIKK
jgi:surface protein